MTGITYDPILGPFDEPPKPRAGHITVVMDGSRVRDFVPENYKKSAFSDFDFSMLTANEKLIPSVIAGIAFIAFLAWLSNLFWLFILALIGIGAGAYYYVQQKEAEQQNGDMQFYQVDMRVHSIEQSRNIPIADTGFDSMVNITYAAKALDAKGIVKAGVNDVRMRFSDMIYRQLVQHTQDALINGNLNTFLNTFRASLERLSGEFSGDELVEMADVVFDARVENEPELRDLIRARALRPSDLEKISFDSEIRQAERDQHDYLSDEAEFYKEFMREGADHERMIAAMNLRIQQQNSVSENHIQLLNSAQKAGFIDIEPQDLAKHFPGLNIALLKKLGAGLMGTDTSKPLENKADSKVVGEIVSGIEEDESDDPVKSDGDSDKAGKN